MRLLVFCMLSDCRGDAVPRIRWEVAFCMSSTAAVEHLNPLPTLVFNLALLCCSCSLQVNTTLGHLLEPAAGLMEPFSTRWVRLTGARRQERKGKD